MNESPYFQPKVESKIATDTVPKQDAGVHSDAENWNPDDYRTVKLSPRQIKWYYFCLYRWLDLESFVHWILDRVRYRRLRVVYKLKGYAMERMEKDYDAKTSASKKLSSRGSDREPGEAKQ